LGTIANLVVKISADTSEMKSQLGAVSGSVEGLASSLTSLGNVAKVNVEQAIVNAFKNAVNEAIKFQDIVARTDAVLKSTGKGAQISSEGVGDLAKSLEKTTAVSKETIQSGENMLLTFNNIGGKVLPAATQAALDLAAGLGQDVPSAAMQLGKALQDPVEGMASLQRMGVKLDDSQKELIKRFMAVGDVAGAQNVILKEVEKHYGGAAAAGAETLGGSLKQLENSFTDLVEGGLKEMTPELKSLGKDLANFLEMMANAGAGKVLINLLKDIVKVMDAFVVGIGLGMAALDGFYTAMDEMRNGKNPLEAIKDGMAKTAADIKTLMQQTGQEAGSSFAQGANQSSGEAQSAGQNTGNSYAQGVSSSSGQISGAVVAVNANAMPGWHSSLDAAAAAGQNTSQAYIEGVGRGGGGAAGAAGGVANAAANGFRGSGGGGGASWGEQLTSSFNNGILSGAGRTAASAQTVAESANGGLSGGLGGGMQSGAPLSLQFVDGLLGGQGQVSAAAKAIGDTVNNILGFSLPKEGPLMHFDQSMPDMINLMVGGINNNRYKLTDAAKSMASGINIGVNSYPSVAGVGAGGGGYQTANIIVQLDSKVLTKQLGQNLVDTVRLKTGKKV